MILYVKSLIKRAELAKFLFTREPLRDIEYGQQVYIPHEIPAHVIRRSPMSLTRTDSPILSGIRNISQIIFRYFRYYDPILRFVEENIDEDRREFFLNFSSSKISWPTSFTPKMIPRMILWKQILEIFVGKDGLQRGRIE